MAPILRELAARKIETSIIHTNQHYSSYMDEVFWQSLDLPRPTHRLKWQATGHSAQVAEMLLQIGSALDRLEPDWVLVHGDTNSTMAGALAASKMPNTRLAHVEAGLRSFDRSMPEEINRVVVDHLSHLLFSPTEIASTNLRAEGIASERIHQVGNTIEDALRSHIDQARARSLSRVFIEEDPYAVLTLHRQENTSDPLRFQTMLASVFSAAAEVGLAVVFPAHPRTANLLRSSGLALPENVQVTEPLDYFGFLSLLSRSQMIITDSGGLQEEACLLGKPCVTLRENTERPETLQLGANLLSGVSPGGISRAIRLMARRQGPWPSPYGHGQAARRIIDCLEGEMEKGTSATHAEFDALDKDLGIFRV
jgi:UDP-N-acetylglucosamine 2-epimerase (non-hydrolysing)